MRAEVPEALHGERVDRVVAMIAEVTRAEAAALVAAGAVRVGGHAVTTRSRKVTAGDVLEVDVPERTTATGVEPEPEVAVTVVHEDDAVLVVDKGAELVVHPGAGRERGTLVAGLLARYPELAVVGEPLRPGIVHRLDRGTSGLLVVARTRESYEDLVSQLSNREVTREYVALVWDHVASDAGMVDAPIGRSESDPTRMAVAAAGREARTRYEVERRFAEPAPCTLLTCHLDTGRTHQIRVHLAAIGHPVVGDPRYGGDRSPLAIGRPFLHARRLAFDHPTTGDRVSFEAPLPDELAVVLARLG